MQSEPITQFLPINNLAFIPVGRDGAVCKTEFSPTLVKLETSTLLMSPLITALYHTEAYLLSYTSPMIVADGAIQFYSVLGSKSKSESFITCLEYSSVTGDWA